MEKLNKEKVTQTEALLLIDRKLKKEENDFIHSNNIGLKIVHFNIYAVIQEDSVTCNVYFEEVSRLLKASKQP